MGRTVTIKEQEDKIQAWANGSTGTTLCIPCNHRVFDVARHEAGSRHRQKVKQLSEVE